MLNSSKDTYGLTKGGLVPHRETWWWNTDIETVVKKACEKPGKRLEVIKNPILISIELFH